MKSYWAVIEYTGHTAMKARGGTPREAAESVLADYLGTATPLEGEECMARVVDLVDRETGEPVPAEEWGGQENGASENREGT